MENNIRFVKNTFSQKDSDVKLCTCDAAAKVRSFHESFPDYSPTPLVKLSGLSERFNVGGIFVKDESFRFGLNAFKALGGSYAIGRIIADRLGIDISQLPFSRLVSDEIKEKTGSMTFITATDGNHGRGVAWTANRLGKRCIVYLPKGTAVERLENIRALGAEAEITELVYDDAVRLARKEADEKGYVLVQDTTLDAYEDIPKLIMLGYTTMALEAVEQLGNIKPTHVFLQAGVGSMAAAVAEYISNYYGAENRPLISVVEPNGADCIFRTADANDGELHFVKEPQSIMAGLCCGEPCSVAWDMLRQCTDYFFSIPDSTAVHGMRALAYPVNGDKSVVSGESGASTFGLVCELLGNAELSYLRDELKINDSSVILCFSTEGATDRENYNRIVCDTKREKK